MSTTPTTSGQDDTLSAYRFSQDISRAASIDSARPSMQINRPPPKPEEQYTAYERAKKYIWNLTEQETHPTLLGRIFNIAIVSCIIISCLHLIYETEPEWVITDTGVLLGYQIFRLCYTILFCVEYFLRLWSCTASRHYTNYGAVRGRIRFFFSFRSLIDIFSILPSLVSLSLMSNDFMKTGVVHLTDTHASGLTFLRLLRFAKLGRKSKTIHRLKRLAINRRDDIYSCAVVVVMSWIIMSCLLYYAERDAQPEHFGSIISAMWFSAVTMTTIGYGDVTPKTVFGKVLTIAFGICALIFFSLLVSIIGGAYMEQTELDRKKKSGEHILEKERKQQAEQQKRELYEMMKDLFIKVNSPGMLSKRGSFATQQVELEDIVITDDRVSFRVVQVSNDDCGSNVSSVFCPKCDHELRVAVVPNK